MILHVLEALVAFYTLIKGFRQYKRLSAIYQKIKNTSLSNVSELTQLLKNKKPYQKLYVIVKGIAKAYSEQDQKNIFSLIQTKDLRIKPALNSSLQKVGWSKIVQNAFWRRPRILKNIKFYLKDWTSQHKIPIQNCQNTNFNGALTQVFSDKIIYPQSKSKLVIFLKDLYNIISSIFPFNLFLKNIKYGQQIKYFGIMDGQYTLAIGEVYKDKQGIIKMIQPLYLTKQKGFIQQRLKTKLNYIYWIILIIGLIQVYVLYQIGKTLIKKYMKKKQEKIRDQEEQKRSQQQGDFANCVICYTNIRSIVLKPCKHYGFCNQCYDSFKDKGCPMCKSQIDGIIKIVKKK